MHLDEKRQAHLLIRLFFSYLYHLSRKSKTFVRSFSLIFIQYYCRMVENVVSDYFTSKLEHTNFKLENDLIHT